VKRDKEQPLFEADVEARLQLLAEQTHPDLQPVALEELNKYLDFYRGEAMTFLSEPSPSRRQRAKEWVLPVAVMGAGIKTNSLIVFGIGTFAAGSSAITEVALHSIRRRQGLAVNRFSKLNQLTGQLMQNMTGEIIE